MPPTVSFSGSPLRGFNATPLRARNRSNHNGPQSILLAYAISRFDPQLEWFYGHVWGQNPGFVPGYRAAGPINYPPFPTWAPPPTDRDTYYNTAWASNTPGYIAPYYRDHQVPLVYPGTGLLQAFGLQSGTLSAYGSQDINFLSAEPRYRYDTDPVLLKIWIYSFPSSMLFRTDEVTYIEQIPYSRAPWDYGFFSGFDKKFFTPIEGKFTIICKSILQTNQQQHGARSHWIGIPGFFNSYVEPLPLIPSSDGYYSTLTLALDYFADVNGTIANNPPYYDLSKDGTLTFPFGVPGRVPDPSKHVNWIFDKDWGVVPPEGTGAEIIAPNIFKVQARKFTHQTTDDGWGWQGQIYTDGLDDTAYMDYYGTYLDARRDPDGFFSAPMLSYRDSAECYKPDAEFLGFDIEFEDTEGNKTPDYDPEHKTLKATAARILANKIHIYQNVRVLRVASSYVYGYCTNYDPTGGVSPYYDINWYDNPLPPGFDIGFTYLSDPGGPSPTTVDHYVGATGFAGPGCGVSRTSGVGPQVSIVLEDKAPWRTVPCLYSVEFKEIPCQGVQSKDNVYESTILGTGFFGGNLCFNQAWSTRDDHTYIIHQQSCGDPMMPFLLGMCMMSGPVDIMEEMLLYDKASGPFVYPAGGHIDIFGNPVGDTLASWDFVSCHRRFLSGWALRLTPEELLNAAGGVGDSLATITALAQDDLDASMAFILPNVNAFYLGDIDPPVPANSPWVREDFYQSVGFLNIPLWECPSDRQTSLTTIDNPDWGSIGTPPDEHPPP